MGPAPARPFSSVLTILWIVMGAASVSALTCPGFPGYCSESFPGQTCVVVCSRGRNNVPLCQEDGTWTDIPRCIEHDPGVQEQIPGVCPGISGYCSDGFVGQRCNFPCSQGAPVNSLCTQDGTWSPYPTCEGDLRETQDGCVACPGPNGGARNRTAEALLGIKLHNPRPSSSAQGSLDNQGRQVIPTFSGNQAFGALPTTTSSRPELAQPSSFQPNLESAGLRQPQQPAQPATPQQPQFARPQAQAAVPQQQLAPQQFSRQPQPSQPAQFPQQQFAQPQQQQFAQPQQQQFAQPPPQQQQQQPQQQQFSQPPPQQQQQFAQPPPQQQQQFGQQPPQGFGGGQPQGGQRSGFSPEQQQIIQQGIARVQGFGQNLGQLAQLQDPRLAAPPNQPPPNFSAQTPVPRGPRPDHSFVPQDRFGPFEVVQPAEENIVDTGPLTPFQAIPDDTATFNPKPRERPSAFGPFQLVDL